MMFLSPIPERGTSIGIGSSNNYCYSVSRLGINMDWLGSGTGIGQGWLICFSQHTGDPETAVGSKFAISLLLLLPCSQIDL